MYFITSRLADSMSQERLQEWHQQRETWLKNHAISDFNQLDSLPDGERHQFHATFTTRWHDWLDNGYGECYLRQSDLREYLIQRLHSLDGISCELDAWTIMPNHFHALVIPTTKTLGEVVRQWKGGSARDINQHLGRTGPLWQAEPYDHIVRSEAQLHHYRRYIAENPIKASLPESHYACGFGKKVVWASAQSFKVYIDEINEQK